MSKQLIFVIGIPQSGRSTWIGKNHPSTDGTLLVDANFYPGLYVKSETSTALAKLYEDTIEDSRKWCLEKVKANMESETPSQKIILVLIACRPNRWREFIQLAIAHDYELVFKFPSNKLLYYITKHNTSMEQSKFIESKVINKYPKDKKEIHRKDAKGQNETVMVETNESSLFRYIVSESESAHAFYLQKQYEFGNDKAKLLEKINEYYKSVIIGEVKRAEKKAKDVVREAEKKAKEAERESRKLAKEEEKARKEQENKEVEYSAEENVQESN